MMKKTILIAIATTLLCSCNKEVDETGNITLPERPISIYTAIQSEKTPTVSPQTRAPITGTDAELKDITFYLWQSTNNTIDLSATPFSPFSSYTGTRAGSNTGAIIFNEGSQPVYDQKENKYAFLVGCWANATATTADNSLTWTIDGKTDILISDLWCAGTYLAPITGAESGSGASPLTFKHRLAQLEVFCKAADGETLNDVQATWGNIKSIKLLDAYPQMNYDATTNKITGTGNKTAISLLKPDYETAFEATAIQPHTATEPAIETATAAGMYAPSDLIVLRITTEGATTTTTDDDLIRTFAIQFVDENDNNVDFVAGKKHTVNILFSTIIKDLQIEITYPENWTVNSETPSDGLGGSQEVDTEGPGNWDENNPNGDGTPVEDELGTKETTPTT